MIDRTQSSPPVAPWPPGAPFYIMVRRGIVQHLGSNGEDGWPNASLLIARSHADAIRLARWLSRVRGRRVSPARVGTVRLSNGERETIENVIAWSLVEPRASSAVVVPLGWREDGSPSAWWKLDYPDRNGYGADARCLVVDVVAAVLRGEARGLAAMLTLFGSSPSRDEP